MKNERKGFLMNLRKSVLLASAVLMLTSANAQEPVRNIQDLVGSPRGNGDRQMQRRGYQYIRTDGSGQDLYSYYTEPRSGRCITVHIGNGRYESLQYNSTDIDCRGNSGGGGASNLQDLVGARGGDGEYQLQQRGYVAARNEVRGNSRYLYWRKGGECVEVELSNGRYTRVSGVDSNLCRQASFGGGSGAGALQDLVGARGGDGESQLQQRGYSMTRNDLRGNERYSYWRKGNECVEVVLANGRYDRINGTGMDACRSGGGGFGSNDNQITDRRRASIRGGGGQGKCTVEVVVDNVAEVEIRGDNALIRTLSGGPATFRRFECNQIMPNNPYSFRFAGVDGRGRQNLQTSPEGGRAAIIRIEDSKGGSEGYTFDIFWSGGR